MRRAAVCAGLLALACGGDEAAPAARPAALPVPALRDTTVWRGIYARAESVITFQPCRERVSFEVRAPDSLLTLLDANVDWHAPRPTTTIYVQLQADTVPLVPGGLVLAVAAVDSSRDVGPGECTPVRPEIPPPPDPARLAAGLRQALGADSGWVRPGAFQAVSAWLNGGDEPDAVVLVTAPAACERYGCTLVLLEGTDTGYRLAGRTAHVQRPIYVLESRTNGWHDIQVGTGAYIVFRWAALEHRLARYPEDAQFEPDARRYVDGRIPGRLIMDDPDARRPLPSRRRR